MQLLHLEDSPADAVLLANIVQSEWPGCKIRRAATAGEYQAALDAGGFDLILSDYSMPGFDGLSALAMARARFPETPFLFLSGTIGEERAVEALKGGATDYIIKDRPGRLIPAMRQAIAIRVESRRRQQGAAALQDDEAVSPLSALAGELVAVVDVNGRRIYANPFYGELFGEAALWPGTDAFGEVHADDRARTQAAFAGVLRDGQSEHWVHRLKLPDGGIRSVESHASALRDATGQVVNVFLVSREVEGRDDPEPMDHAALLDQARATMQTMSAAAVEVVHDLNNDLTPILLSVSLLSARMTNVDDRRLIEIAKSSATHAAGVVQRLLAVARGAEGGLPPMRPALGSGLDPDWAEASASSPED